MPIRKLSTPNTIKKSSGLNALMKEYGYSALGVYFVLSMVDLPLCYLLVHSMGKDEVERYENKVKRFFGFGMEQAELDRQQNARQVEGVSNAKEPEGQIPQNLFSDFSWTEFALAYGLHKSLVFIRLPICAAITPSMVRLLRRWGFQIGATKFSADAVMVKDKVANITLPALQIGTRPSNKQRWFTWFF